MTRLYHTRCGEGGANVGRFKKTAKPARVASETFGEPLSRLREAEGLTIAALAEQLDVSEGAIRQIGAGWRPKPVVHGRPAAGDRASYDHAFGEGGGCVSARLDLLDVRVARLAKRRRRPTR